MSLDRFAHWVWWSTAPPARVARGVLLPFAMAYRTVMSTRARAYASGLLRQRPLPLPAVAIGNLAVGGAGKTPFAAWTAAYFARHGVKPGILLRGYRGDEQAVHQRLVPEAVVVPNPDRLQGAEQARTQGARVLVLDDAYQRLDVGRDVNVAIVSTESAPPRHVAWPLPAGPWRERWPAAVVGSVHFVLDGLAGIRSGRRMALGALAGKRVVVAAGIADPASFAAQVRAAGASVQLMAYQDHHDYPPGDVARLARAAKDADYVVVTEKDAVKLRSRWPSDAPEPLVAELALRWELNGDAIERVLDEVLKKVV